MLHARGGLIRALGVQYLTYFSRDELAKMNTKQWAVILVAVGLFFITELFPPWLYVSSSNRCIAGYSFITRPPTAKSFDEMKKLCTESYIENQDVFETHKDQLRLNWQRVILVLLSAGLLLVLESRRSALKTILGLSALSVGLAILWLYISNVQYFHNMR